METNHQSSRADIETRADIAALMQRFYGSMFEDEIMGPIFIDIAQMDLEAHIPIMCDFWELQLFQKPGYRGGMMMVHFQLNMLFNLEHHHFMRWLDYWYDTLDAMFAGPRTDWAKTVAARIANNMAYRMDEVNGNITAPPVHGLHFG